MKKIKILALLIVLTGLRNVQAQPQVNADNRKYIEVTGSAEMTVQPDEIELRIVLSEYNKNGKKVGLDKVQSLFDEVLKKNNIKPETLMFEDMEGYWWYWWSSRDAQYHTKTVKLKLSKETNFLSLVEGLNEKWVQDIRISNSTNKNIQKYRKEIKIEAVKAAKEKAAYLLESLNEQIGGVLSIEEIPDQYKYWWDRGGNLASNTTIYQSNTDENNIENVAGIKLRYEIKAKFGIK